MENKTAVQDSAIFALLAPRVDLGYKKSGQKVGLGAIISATVVVAVMIFYVTMQDKEHLMPFAITGMVMVVCMLACAVWVKLSEKKELLAYQVSMVTGWAKEFGGPEVFETSREEILAKSDKVIEDLVKDILQIQDNFRRIPKIQPIEAYRRIQAVHRSHRYHLMQDLKTTYDKMLAFGVVPEGGYQQYFDRFAKQ